MEIPKFVKGYVRKARQLNLQLVLSCARACVCRVPQCREYTVAISARRKHSLPVSTGRRTAMHETVNRRFSCSDRR